MYFKLIPYMRSVNGELHCSHCQRDSSGADPGFDRGGGAELFHVSLI